MDGCSKPDMDCPQLLDLIPKDREWLVQRGEQNSHGSSEEKKLELRLGPPGEERDESSLLSLGYFSNKTNQNRGIRGFTNAVEMKPGEKAWIMNNNNNNNGGQTHFSFSENPFGSSSDYMVKTRQQQQQQQGNALFPLIQSNPQRMAIKAKESSHGCPNKGEDLQQKNAEKKVFPPPPPASANPAVATNSSQKRTAPAPVVGWPPIRSFRKNLASSSSSKPIPESQNVAPNKELSEKPAESCKKGFFVKINMDGVPIGRKVDLKAYDSYENLSSSVDELFRGLLAAQRDSSASGIQNKQEGEKAITGLLDGSGEYTLVYEDNEGDRMLVGDVPWHMFVSTVKRLRVLKTSELSTLRFGNKQQKIPLDAAKN
ncbi:hypothetical protein RHSIM_Rhsim08G0228000 [Rhododendron simsii]|uniref:Auxin-responsive protein n=1 Tax=Rhododendron simsii TaxID=118357 RepID=A0A834GSR7_RHOSS|nr:hypothetical protein RHSIM_Rhsim08G0228000 [Rhododendron simsii]